MPVMKGSLGFVLKGSVFDVLNGSLPEAGINGSDFGAVAVLNRSDCDENGCKGAVQKGSLVEHVRKGSTACSTILFSRSRM